jgi:hypothetical protein
MLAPDHPLGRFSPKDIGGDAIIPLEKQLWQALDEEHSRPSLANLPRDGSMIERTTVNPQTNARETSFFGRESFIKAMNRVGRRVVAIHDQSRGGQIIYPVRARGL